MEVNCTAGRAVYNYLPLSAPGEEWQWTGKEDSTEDVERASNSLRLKGGQQENRSFTHFLLLTISEMRIPNPIIF